ncbi:7275_t:CDS:2, partial [Cetraspora pellucida]
MSKDEKNMFLLGILNALVRKETTKNNINKKYLTNEYQFDGNHICLEAFLLMYNVSEWKWKSIHRHFNEKTKPIIFLPATDNYLSLFHLYNSIISNTSNISI